MSLYAVTAGETALAADVNQYQDVLEGASTTQFALRQATGANFILRLPDAAGTYKFSIQDSGANEVASINSDGAFVGILTPTTFTFPAATSPSQTTDAQAVWDSDDNRLTVGSGTKTLVFSPSTYIKKTSTETVNNTNTLQSDDVFLFTIAAGESWLVEAFLFLNSGTTPDFKCAWTLANTTYFVTAPLNITAATGVTAGTSTASGTATAVQTTASDSLWVAQFVVVSSTGAGTCNFQWAQNTMDASDTSIKAGSWMRFTQILG